MPGCHTYFGFDKSRAVLWHNTMPQINLPPSRFSVIMHPCRKDLYTIPGGWKWPRSSKASIFTKHVTHWACLGCSGLPYFTECYSFCQYPETSHSHWRGVGEHSTGHNQQPDQLYAKEMCRTAWWSHQILTCFLIHAYLYSQSCEIHRLGTKEFISIDWFPYMNFNSVKS